MSNITKLPGPQATSRGIDALVYSVRNGAEHTARALYDDAVAAGAMEAAAVLQAALMAAARTEGMYAHRKPSLYGPKDKVYSEHLYDEMAVIPGGSLPLPGRCGPFAFVVQISRGSKTIESLAIDIVKPDQDPRTFFVFDRMVQEYGVDIYHFTETEVLTDPLSCASQIIDWSDAREYEG